MTWVRLDDHFDEHEKIVGLTPDAFKAHVRAICYCARNLTDGRLPGAVARAFAVRPRILKELVPSLWEEDGEHYRVHDYLDYNPTREAVLAEREAARNRMQRGRSRDVRANNGRTSDELPEKFDDPVPVPVPSGLSDESPTTPKTRARKEVKRLTEAHVREMVDEWGSVDVLREAAKFQDYIASKGGNEHGGVYKDEVAGFRNWLRRAEESNGRTSTSGRPHGPRAVGTAGAQRAPTKLFG